MARERDEPGREGEPKGRVTRTTTFFVILALGSASALAWRDGGAELVDALATAATLLLSIAPVIGAALLLGGYVNALLPHDRVARWLGPDSGLRGYGLALLGGVVTPAGPFAVFPILVGLRAAGAGFAVCVVYVTAWATLGLQRMIVWELPFLGFDFVALRIVASLPLPIVAGVLAAAVARRVNR
ncbi:MAG: permease [Halofilum sp. (in: g-proteobacteria)]|nr:permease [Halofilum sp. (in: g-proteobacteria)]